MGEAQHTIKSSLNYSPEVVEPSVVVSLLELSDSSDKPVLLISSLFESELNSRWINTLSEQWDDSSWSNWMNIRNLINDQNWLGSTEAVLNSGIIIGTDDQDLFNVLSESIPKQICLLQTYGSCDFR
jgi:hypothetical protein